MGSTTTTTNRVRLDSLAAGVGEMELTQGRTMRVSGADLPRLAGRRWRAVRSSSGLTWYAVTNVRRPSGRRTTLRAHRLIMGLDFGDPREVDHIDHDGLNNVRSNLRVTDGGERRRNQHNLRGKYRHLDGPAPTSAHPGVHWNKRAGKWRAYIRSAGRQIHLGFYDDEFKAAEAYVRAKAVRDAGGTGAKIRAAGGGR